MLDMAPSKQAATWLYALARALETDDAEAAANLFVDDCYWRDLLTFTWNITTMEGRDAIRDMLQATLAKPSHWTLSGEATSDEGTVEAWFGFETSVARGPAEADWRAHHHHREECASGRFLAQPLSLARAARPGLVRPSALHPVPRELAGVHAQGQDGRLAGDVCQGDGAQLLGCHQMR